MSNVKTSWKTTVGGIMIGVGLLIRAFEPALDSDPATTFSFAIAWPSISAALGAMGIGIFARDHNVSSETAGAHKEKE